MVSEGRILSGHEGTFEVRVELSRRSKVNVTTKRANIHSVYYYYHHYIYYRRYPRECVREKKTPRELHRERDVTQI